MKIVGITGKKRSGKDTAAAVLTEQRGFVRIGFADALKRMALAVDPIVEYPRGSVLPRHRRLRYLVETIGWERAKDGYPEVRRLLDKLGTEGVRDIIGEDSWISALVRQAARSVPEDGNLVVPDVRFLNEAGALRDDFWMRGPTLIIRVVRPSLADDGDRHASETEQDQIVPDVTITNDSSEADLHRAVLAVVDDWAGKAAA